MLNRKRGAVLLQVRDPFVPFVFCDDGIIIADCTRNASVFLRFMRKHRIFEVLFLIVRFIAASTEDF